MTRYEIQQKDISKACDDSSSSVESAVDDFNAEFSFAICEIGICKQEMFAACHCCQIVLSFSHFTKDTSTCFEL